MRAAGRLVAEVHLLLAEKLEPGITTEELDALAEDAIREAGAKPAFKGYRGYPATICASIDEEVVHGIPGARRLQEGEIISIDLGVIIKGYYGDAARTLPVGRVEPEAKRLLQVTERALEVGVKKCREGNRLSDVSHSIQSFVEARGLSVVRDYVGHGIGQQMHEAPQIPNFGPPGRGPHLTRGMALALEPMVNIGSYRVKSKKDGWTVVTSDGSLSAHFEDTVFITDRGPEVLTTLNESQ